MADIPAFMPNPYANFDPSQWSNPYSKFYGQALPFPASYVGSPNDAMGNPIAGQAAAPSPAAAPGPPPGTTLNSAPGAGGGNALFNSPAIQQLLGSYQAAQAAKSPQQLAAEAQSNAYRQQALQQQNNLSAARAAQGGFGNMPGGAFNPGPSGSMPQPAIAAQPAASQPAAAPAGNLMGLNAALALLANPGKVTTPGATVPQSATSYQPGSGVLQQFLANWKPASSGPGSGFQQGFAKALKGT